MLLEVDKKFASKSWNERNIRRLLKTEDASLVDRHQGWQTMNCTSFRECDLDDLVFSQEDVPQTHQSVLKISMNAVTYWSSVGCIIYDHFRIFPPM